MSLQTLLTDDKRKEEIIKAVSAMLVDRIDNVSDYLIASMIKTAWDDSVSKRENIKNIAQLLIIERISLRRRQILLHSCIYYQFDTNVVSDAMYDKMCLDLKRLQTKFPKLSEKAVLHKVFQDWHKQDTTTGYDLPHDNPKVKERARRVIDLNAWYKNN